MPKIKGSYREVIDSQGAIHSSFYPVSQEGGVEEDTIFYLPYPQEPCPVSTHGGNPLRFTKTQIAKCCAIDGASRAYLTAKKNGEPLDTITALLLGTGYYWKSSYGRNCGHPGKVTVKGKCWYCAQEKVVRKAPRKISPRQAALSAGEKWYMPAAGDLCKFGHHALRRVADGVCQECCPTAGQGVEMSPRQAAIGAGEKWYMPEDPCKFGHHALRRVQDGLCQECSRAASRKVAGLSPRQAAIRAGEKWYMPEDPCKMGHTALRRVDNGTCKECIGATEALRPDKLWPDIILDRDDAIAAGFNVYRTGQACKKGHTGWRYVSTRGCLDCLGRG